MAIFQRLSFSSRSVASIAGLKLCEAFQMRERSSVDAYVPMAKPANIAAPNAVVSLIMGRMTSVPKISA